MVELIAPLDVTLRKYGLSVDAWRALADKQGHVCAVCLRPPKNGRLNIDHAHVKGWKQMPDEERVKYVRGLCCYQCNNRTLTKGITQERLRRAAAYLDAFEAVRPPAPPKKARRKTA